MNNNNPGSILSKVNGCCCPSDENNYGAGLAFAHGWGFLINIECPIHSPCSPNKEQNIAMEKENNNNRLKASGLKLD